MGIDGLLNLLRPVTKKQHISTFKNKTIGIDAMPWIYKGCYSCAVDLNQDVESIDFLYYILEMLDLLSYYNIKPIFVFDGRAIQAKGQTLQKRKKNKQQNKQKGLEFLKNNQPQQARKYLSRCIIIDQRILATTMCALLTKNIQFIVAPYEADCQIAKLRKLGIIDAAISQDSDLVTFGVNVLLKINQNGECDYVDLSLWKSKDVTDIFLKYFLAFDQLTRIDAAVLAGSDYNPSVKGIGIKRAIKLLSRQVTMHNVINKLKHTKQYAHKIPENYQNMIQRSKLIFNFSTVYNPLSKQLQFLKPELLNQLKPESMTIEELQAIVGIHYPYNEEVKSGKIISKTLQPRQLKILNFRQIFRINKENLIIHQTLNKQRRRQQQQAKKRLQQQRRQQNGGVIQEQDDFLIVDHLNSMRKKARQSVNMTEEQKQKKKQQRKNRIVRLQDMMNTLVDAFGDLQSENQGEDQINQDIGQQFGFQDKRQILSLNSPHKVFLTNKDKRQKPTTQKQEKKDIYVEQQQSNSQDLGFLNPFAKKQMKVVSLKHQNLNSNNKTFK